MRCNMRVHTLVVSVVIPLGDDPKPVATVVWPSGEIQRITLTDHDWVYDWSRDGRAPASFYRWFRDQSLVGGYNVHGDRKVYSSPEEVGTGTNEGGRLTVWEIDYEA
jgi:hypothetical protein